MFRVPPHPSSGVLKTVTAASGVGHDIGTATSLQRGQVGTETTGTAFSTSDDGCGGHPKYEE